MKTPRKQMNKKYNKKNFLITKSFGHVKQLSQVSSLNSPKAKGSLKSIRPDQKAPTAVKTTPKQQINKNSRGWFSGELAIENSTRPNDGLKRGSPLLKPWSDHPLYHRCEPFNHSRKKNFTIDLQMAIIEKIKKIKQKRGEKRKKLRRLTMLCSFFVASFCLKLKGRGEKEEKKRNCSKMQHWRCQIFVAVSWSYYFHSPGFQCVWTFSLSLLFCLWYLAFFPPA